MLLLLLLLLLLRLLLLLLLLLLPKEVGSECPTLPRGRVHGTS